MHLQLGCCSHGSQGWAGRQTCSRKLRTARGPWRFVTELCGGGVEGRAVCGWPHCLLLAASHCERQRHALAAGHQEFNGAAPWLLGAVDGVSAAGSSVVPHRRGTALHTSQARSCSETPGCAPAALTDHCPVLLGAPTRAPSLPTLPQPRRDFLPLAALTSCSEGSRGFSFQHRPAQRWCIPSGAHTDPRPAAVQDVSRRLPACGRCCVPSAVRSCEAAQSCSDTSPFPPCSVFSWCFQETLSSAQKAA